MNEKIFHFLILICAALFLLAGNAFAEDQDLSDGIYIAQSGDCSADFTYEIIKTQDAYADVYFNVKKPFPVAEYNWSFGDGKGTKKMEPTHRFDIRDKNEFTVTLTVKKGTCTDKKSVVVSFKGPAPKETCSAEFKYDIKATTAEKGTVQFSSTMNNADVYIWDFGDGDTSSDRNPVHVYDISGSKEATVTLSVQKGKCYEESTQKIIFPKVKEESIKGCSAKFESTVASKTNEKATVRFKAAMRDASRYEWEFGDGKKSLDMDPVHVYGLTKTNKYQVTLKVLKSGCSDKTTEILEFDASGSSDSKACTAEFDFEIINQNAQRATVQFNVKMTDAATYSWEFGDGKKSMDMNPVHIYMLKSSTEFQATLTVTRSGCTDKKMKRVDLKGGDKPGNCDADFTFDIGKREKGRSIVLFRNVMTDASSYFWDFGDGDTSDEENPEHYFKLVGKREYTVTLTVRKGKCTDTKAKSISLQADPEEECTADFTFKITRRGHRRGTVRFEAKLKEPKVSVSWDFGDGDTSKDENPIHNYNLTNKNKFNVTLTTKKGSCTDSKTLEVSFVNDQCSAEFTVKTTFNDGKMARVEVTTANGDPYAEYKCDFGDGAVSAEWNPVHTYNIRKQKTYTVILSIKKGDCTDEYEYDISF